MVDSSVCVYLLLRITGFSTHGVRKLALRVFAYPRSPKKPPSISPTGEHMLIDFRPLGIADDDNHKSDQVIPGSP